MIIKTNTDKNDWIKSKQKKKLCKVEHIKKKCYNFNQVKNKWYSIQD